MSGATMLDTNVLSELLSPTGDPKVLAFLESLANPLVSVLVSVVIFHELAYGVEMMPAGIKRARLSAGIETFRNRFLDRAVPISIEIAEIAGRLRAGETRSGFVLDAPDAFIAASALTVPARLATRNTRHFERLGIELVNPWAG
jgi:predicted nucleic acid-binding protein